MNKYIGHPSQICGIEEVSLLRGKGKGMTLLNIRNGLGLELTLSADRAMDISRLSYNGSNMGYFAPCGYVAPSFYDNKGAGFLKSFTAGFLTTCGLTAVGSPCTDEGEELPLHGTLSNTPCESYCTYEDEEAIFVEAEVRDASLFGRQLILHRQYVISKLDNKIRIFDTVENVGNSTSPCMLLYHFNIGYPLLSENAKLYIPANSVSARNEHAAEDIDNCRVLEKPQVGYEERCYYYDVAETDDCIASVGIFNPDINKGLILSYSKDTLDSFVEWKMMGEYEYVLGLEPANCTPDGRDVMREEGKLKFVEPGERYETELTLYFSESRSDIEL